MKRIDVLFFFCLLTSLSVSAQMGTLWATASRGASAGEGSIFSITVNGTGFSTHHDFDFNTGAEPWGDMILASDGKLYGTAEYGGTGVGVLYSFDPVAYQYQVEYSFQLAGGIQPFSGLIEVNGILYGVAPQGGANLRGVIYSYNLASHVYTDLYDFDQNICYGPVAPPVFFNGKLYGTTLYGGADSAGAIYRYDLSAGSLTVLHSFNTAADGSNVQTSLLHASDGYFYGYAGVGGANNTGTIFRYDDSLGVFTKIYDFAYASGCSSAGAPVEWTNGVLLGTGAGGGPYGCGDIFSFDLATGTYHSLHDFNYADGCGGGGNLLLLPNGTLFGNTSLGGIDSMGAVFSYDLNTNMFTSVHSLTPAEGSHLQSGFCYVSHTNDIREPSQSDQFCIYPVLANTTLNILSDDHDRNEWSIINTLGQEVMKWESGSFDQEQHIDISGLQSGIYFVRMQSREEGVTKKFVKQ